MRTLLTLCAALLLMGCAAKEKPRTAEKQPDWVIAQSAQYPENAYLTGRGSGANQTIAADRARSDLIKNIEVTVESATQSRTSVAGGAYESSFTQQVLSKASRTIEGVEIGDRWYDKKSDLHYALATLDRAKAAGRLRSKIAEAQGEIGSLINEAAAQPDALLKLGLFQKASKRLEEREADNAVLAVLDGRGAGGYAEGVMLKEERRKAIAALKLAVGGDKEAIGLLTGALGKAGFKLVQENEAQFVLRGDLKTDTRLFDGWQWATLTLEAGLIEKASGQARGQWRYEAKDSATDKASAIGRATKQLGGKVDKELPEALMNPER